MTSSRTDDARALHVRGWRVAAPMLAIFAAYAAWLALIAAPGNRREVIESWRAQLAVTADDRAAAVDRWLHDRLGDAWVLAQTAGLRALVATGAPPAGSTTPLPAALRAVVQGYDYRDAYLLGSHIEMLAEVGPDGELAAGGRDLARRVLAGGRPELGFGLDQNKKPLLQFAAPVTGAGAERPQGVVLLVADPADWLYPYLLHATLASPSLETVLVRRVGNDAIFLSPLPDRRSPPLTVRRPLDQPAFAAAAALAGRTGVAEYTDYRGVPVLAATRLLTIVPWGLITKVHLEEAMRPYWTWLHGEILFAAALGAALAGVGFGLWQRQRRIVRQLATEGERRLGEMVQEANDAVFILGPDGRILQASRRAEAMYGRSEDALCHLTLADLRAERERDGVPRTLATALTGTPVTQETVHRRQDGSEFPVEVSTRRVTWQGETYLLDIARDVSDRKKAEEALRASEAKYRETLDAMIEGCQLIGPDWTYLYVNESAARQGRHAREALLGRRITDVYPGFEETKAFAAMRQAMELRQPTSLENEFRYPDGSRAWFELSIQPVYEGVFVLSVDITERKRAELEREVTMRLLRATSSARGLHDLMRETTVVLHDWFGCEAVGIRLHDGDDFPYFETRGFPTEFVKAETSLCLRDPDGAPRRGSDGNPVLECMCGSVLSRRFNPAKPFFTNRGSFWTNSTTKLLASTSEADRQARTRNRCNGEGFESVALVALRAGETTYGLLQLNDKRTDRFTAESIDLLERLADNLAVTLAHRQSQRDLAESEDRYRFLFTNMQEGYAHCRMIHDAGGPVDFVYLDVNESFERLTGLTGVVGRKVSELVPGVSDSSPELLEVYGRVAETGTPARLETYLERTGTWFSISAYSPEPGHFVTVFDDITDRKRAEAALRESEARYRALVESANSAILRWRADGTVAFANEYALRLFGYSAEALVDHPVSVLVPGGDSAGTDLSELVRAIVAAPERFAFNVNENVCRDGRRVWMAWTNRPVYGANGELAEILAVGSDITRVKETEDALRESEARYRFLFTNMLEGYAHCRMLYEDGVPSDFVYLHVNDAFERLTGLSGAVGKRVTELIPGIRESNRELIETYARVAETGNPARFESFVAPLKMWFSISVYSPAREHFVAVFDVITERKRAEEAVREARDRLEARVAERTAALESANRELEAFAYSVSHDLRVPLRAVDGFSRLLAEEHGAALDAEGHRLVGVVREQTARMGQLIDDLLAFSRVGRAEMRRGPVDMNSLAAAAFADLGGPGRGAELSLGPLPVAVGDVPLLRQVWLNLIGNALKFCPADRAPIVEVSGAESDGEVLYSVRDHGVGFDMRYVAKLFCVFQRLHSGRDFPGTGVGLALVQRIVHRHGGRVWAEGAPGEGATFSFTLPAPPREE